MRDVASGSVLAVLAVLYFLGARALPSGQGEPGPVFFPYLLAAILLGLALVIVARGFWERPRVDGTLMRPAGLIILTILYAFLLTPIGFLASTPLYTAGIVLLLGKRGWPALVLPVATTAFIYAAFVLGLGVTLP